MSVDGRSVLMRQARFAASWNAARVQEQAMLKEAVARQTKPLSVGLSVDLSVASVQPNDAETDENDDESESEDDNDDDIPDISGFIDITIGDDDSDRPAYSWIRQLATMHLTPREAKAMQPFLDLAAVPAKSAGPFSTPLTFTVPPFLPLPPLTADNDQVRS